jgi:hypothetical protein
LCLAFTNSCVFECAFRFLISQTILS